MTSPPRRPAPRTTRLDAAARADWPEPASAAAERAVDLERQTPERRPPFPGRAWLLAALSVGTLFSGSAGAATGRDAGMAVAVEGAVEAKPDGGRSMPLAAFSKVREGDRLTVPDGGAVQILFYDSGRRETWPGPSTVMVGPTESKLVKGDVAPVVENMGDNVGEGMNSLRVILTQAEKERGGVTLVRGTPGEPVALDDYERKEIEAARSHYQRWVESAGAAQDIVPELYFAAVLLTYDQRDEAKRVLDAAVRKCASGVADGDAPALARCEAPKLLIEWSDRK